MQYQINVTLTEDDYIAFNHFHALESVPGKKQVQKSRVFLAVFFAALAAIIILILGWTTFSITYITLLGIFGFVYILFFKKIVRRNITKQVQRLKKQGKLPFDAYTTMEFYDDKLVEITEKARTERSYDTLERICVVKDQYIFLYTSSIGAHLLPIGQLNAQTDLNEFLNFICQKCSIVEYF